MRPPEGADGRSQHNDEDVLSGLSPVARLTIAAASEVAVDLGHSFLGCEHLLLALAGEPDQTAGALLRDRGIEAEQIRRSATAALAGMAVGFSQAGQGSPVVLAERVNQLARRVVALEGRLAAGGL